MNTGTNATLTAPAERKSTLSQWATPFVGPEGTQTGSKFPPRTFPTTADVLFIYLSPICTQIINLGALANTLIYFRELENAF